MQLLKNSSVVVGIEWTLHDSVSEAKKAAAAKKHVLVARKVISGECVQGLCKAPPKANKLQAGALLAAAVANDVLIYHRLGNGSVWICAVREGIPLPGYDVVADEESAKATLAEVMSYVPNAEVYGDLSGAKGSLHDLFAQLTPADRKTAALRAPANLVLVLSIMVAILLVAVIGLFIYQYLKQRMAASGPIAAQLQVDQDVRRARLAFETEAKQARQSFLHTPSPSRQFEIWYDVLRNLPVSANGWTPGSFNCDLAACQVLWRRNERALPSTVAYLPGDATDQAFNPTLNESTTRFSIATLAPVAHDAKRIETHKYFRDIAAGAGQFRLTVGPTQTDVKVTPPEQAQGSEPVSLGLEGSWRASGTNPLIAPEFLRKIELPGVSLTAISIKNLDLGRASYTIELEGRYRVGN